MVSITSPARRASKKAFDTCTDMQEASARKSARRKGKTTEYSMLMAYVSSAATSERFDIVTTAANDMSYPAYVVRFTVHGQ